MVVREIRMRRVFDIFPSHETRPCLVREPLTRMVVREIRIARSDNAYWNKEMSGSHFTFKCKKFQIQVTTPEGDRHVIKLLFSPLLDDPTWMMDDKTFPSMVAAIQYIQATTSESNTFHGSPSDTTTQSEISTWISSTLITNKRKVHHEHTQRDNEEVPH